MKQSSQKQTIQEKSETYLYVIFRTKQTEVSKSKGLYDKKGLALNWIILNLSNRSTNSNCFDIFGSCSRELSSEGLSEQEGFNKVSSFNLQFDLNFIYQLLCGKIASLSLKSQPQCLKRGIKSNHKEHIQFFG